jgi:antitoxin (DNA-binding transcriptional repressor) of toxin-antitoxin stability system
VASFDPCALICSVQPRHKQLYMLVLLQTMSIAEHEEVDMQQVTPEEAEARLRDLIKAALEGETVIITEDAEHQVQLVPITRSAHDRVAGSGKGTFTMSDDFDAPLPDFEEYTR